MYNPIILECLGGEGWHFAVDTMTVRAVKNID